MKECIFCKTTETPQWYTGPACKRCYRKNHRLNNAAKYKARDEAHYRANAEAIKDRQNQYYEDHKEECKARSKAHREPILGSKRSQTGITTKPILNREKLSGTPGTSATLPTAPS
jgi:hypothetical protein